ncbi:MAG: 2-phospho-L-lactate transferase [Blastocatellales bacterium]
MITALAGGVGASKLIDGLRRVIPAGDLTIIVNTGDDVTMFGLYIAPDLDIVTYTLAGIVNPATGWGIEGDTFNCIDGLVGYAGGERWFNLGDRDLATHIHRTAMMREGLTLSETADRIRRSLGVESRIIPMTDTHTPTTIVSDEGELHFQEYLVRRRAEPKVLGIRFENIGSASPAPGVAEAILEADGVIICPSNPLISIGPILAVPGMRDLIRETKAKVAAVSPIVGGASLKGPSDRMMADLGYEVSARGVAGMYEDIVDVFILDRRDEAMAGEIERMGMKTVVTDTVMSDAGKRTELAGTTLTAIG